MIERSISRAIVTGPTGAIGIALCLELARHGIRVFAVCRPGSCRRDAIPCHENISVVDCDMSQLYRLVELIPDGADAFFYLAWEHTIGSGRNDMKSQIRNISYTIDAVHAAAALGCRIFVGAGSQAEYGRAEGILRPDTPCCPENGYGMAKLCAGQMSRAECHKLGMDHIWARVLSIYGPGDGPNTMISSVIRQLMEKKKPSLTEGVQKWDYLYSGDAARAFRLLAVYGADGKIYPMGSGEVRSLREYAEILRDTVDPDLELGFGLVPYSALQVMHLQADISQLKADTGFVPTVSFEEGIRLTVNEYKRMNTYE